MTFIPRSNIQERTTHAANDNDADAAGFVSVLDAISLDDDAKIDDLVRRTERMAIAVVIGMAICLIAIPGIYFALVYRM
ncbi:hypothetical protein [Mesorhizobium sp. dw_380]|uniref:hypothetical protein n=1 Tax=Mesorhizobium sp. dw_380 TaxID=2812001 RepID=UPI001BDEB6EA|nr:hypothetical protein [Mesorhizobium sp. dw_380]